MKWYLKVMKQYADFTGRARRQEYWMFVLFNIIFSAAAGMVDGMLGMRSPETGLGVIGGLYSLAVLVPSIAVGVRRLHDVGKSGWMLLIALIPIIGAIWLLVLFATDGQPGENKWGTNPKEESDDTTRHLLSE
jgi:uncharacterized membrane protein YhaH (DUF805 family)